jgi:hypothetical protein
LTFLSGLFGLLSVAVLIGPGVLLLLNDSIAAGVILLALGFLSLPVVSLAVSAKISMAAPAIVLEGHRVLPGLRRSFALTRGPRSGAYWASRWRPGSSPGSPGLCSVCRSRS